MPFITFKQNNLICFYAFLAILLLLNLCFLHPFALFDYDSIHNFQILEEIHHGDWHNLFHHGSPIFYIFYSFFYLFFNNIHDLLIINLFINILAIALFPQIIKNTFWLAGYGLASSLFIFTCSHYFSIESMSLLFSSILWYRIYILIEKTTHNLLITNYLIIGFLCGILLLINYKFIIVLPLMALGFWVIRKEINLNNTLYFKVIYITIIGFLTPIFLLMTVGYFLGLHWYQYPATLYSIFSMSGKPNPTSMELGYYFSYFFYFENIILVPVLVGRLFFLRKYPFSSLEKLLSMVSIGTFIVMCFLAKAPRGLIFILPSFYIWAFHILERVKRFFSISNQLKYLIISFICISLLFQVYRIYNNLYLYKQSSYSLIAQYLKKQKTKVVFTTLGMGIYPYLDKSIKMEVLRDIADTIKFQQIQGKKYLLYDTFCEIAGHESLYVLKQKKAILSYPEKSLLVPTLFLEHSEYTGFSFQKSLELQQDKQREKYQLLLIPLP